MTATARHARELYRVYGEHEYLAGAPGAEHLAGMPESARRERAGVAAVATLALAAGTAFALLVGQPRAPIARRHFDHVAAVTAVTAPPRSATIATPERVQGTRASARAAGNAGRVPAARRADSPRRLPVSRVNGPRRRVARARRLPAAAAAVHAIYSAPVARSAPRRVEFGFER